MRQIVYFSTAAGRQDSIVIAGILAASRTRNRLDQVTGLLVAGGHRYLQVIEGPSTIVGATYDRIRADDRHVAVTLLVDRLVGGRSFRDWSMAFQEEPRLGEFATFQQIVGQLRARVFDTKLRAQIECFSRTFVATPVNPWRRPAPPATLSVDRAH